MTKIDEMDPFRHPQGLTSVEKIVTSVQQRHNAVAKHFFDTFIAWSHFVMILLPRVPEC